MRPISPKSLTALAAIAAALTLSACGNKHDVIHHAETEGVYVDVGEMKYQVQISRMLNPEAIPEDRAFLEGVDPAEAELGPDEVWFAIFMRVENESDEPQVPASIYEIEDQDENVYEPVDVAETNPFHYDLNPIPPHHYAPDPDGIARQVSSIGGMLRLFKVTHDSLQSRPIELIISQPGSTEESTIDLDI